MEEFRVGLCHRENARIPAGKPAAKVVLNVAMDWIGDESRAP
jgi:hypothetical protein